MCGQRQWSYLLGPSAQVSMLLNYLPTLKLKLMSLAPLKDCAKLKKILKEIH